MKPKTCFLLSLLLVPLAALAAATPPKLAPVLQPFVDNHTLAGAVVLVADTNQVLAIEAVGWMDLARRTKMRTDCLFWVASQSKPITATALMMLVDEGKVSVDDPVAKYLPEFKNGWMTVETNQEHTLLNQPVQSVSNSASVSFGVRMETRFSKLSGNGCAARQGIFEREPQRVQVD